MGSLPIISCGLSFYAEKLFSEMGGFRAVMNNSSNRGLCSVELLWLPAAHTIASSALTPNKHDPETMFKNGAEITPLSIQLSLLLLLARG